MLIVEDDVHHARVLTNLMHYARYEVEQATNGAQALDLIRSQPPDLVLLDIMLPILDGFEVLQRLRADPATALIPVIVISARGNPRDVEKGLDLGASDYMVKPVMMEALLARVRTLLRLKEAQDHLQTANADLQRVSDVKGRLVAVVSHELRTPLTSIRGALDLINLANPNLPTRSRHLLDISIRNTDRLIRLVNSVLSFARLESGLDLEIQPVQMEELITRAIEEVEALISPQDIRVVPSWEEDLPPLPADADRVHQILINLLSNAIKFTERGGEVRVTARMEANGIRVEVIDQGPGISPENVARLFEPFSQVGEPRSTGGTGLGLAISREIAQRHKGRIGVESEPGHGSTFWFWLPLPAPPKVEGSES